MSISDFFPTVFCASFAVGYSVIAICMWRSSPERFEKFYREYRGMAPFPQDVTRGTLRAFAVSAPAMCFMALAVAAGDVENYRKAAGNPTSLLSGISGTFLILTAVSWGVYAAVSLFSWPRWLLLPYVRDEKSVWAARRERRAERRAARSSSTGNSSR